MHGMHAATSYVENSAQGSSSQLKFVHGCICVILPKLRLHVHEQLRQRGLRFEGIGNFPFQNRIAQQNYQIHIACVYDP